MLRWYETQNSYLVCSAARPVSFPIRTSAGRLQRSTLGVKGSERFAYVRMRVRIYVLRCGSDDPTKSTALKLVRKGLALKVNLDEIPKCCVLLTVFSNEVFSPLDRELVKSCGLVVIDSSWKRDLEIIKRVSNSWRGPRRILPALVAGNPINYGQISLLSSAEAVAAALYIAGFVEEAFEVLSQFKWGRTFFDLNRELLELYRRASSVDEILRIQEEFLRSRSLI